MSVFWTYSPAPQALWNTGIVPLANIPFPRNEISEAEWKAALLLQNSGYELVNGPGNKPIGRIPISNITEQRRGMEVERFYFHKACRATAYNNTNVYTTLYAHFDSLSPLYKEQYADITVFRRNMPEIPLYFQDTNGGVNLTDSQLDTLFNDAMNLASVVG